MKTVKQTTDEVMKNHFQSDIQSLIDAVAIQFAKQVLEEAAERATTKYSKKGGRPFIDKQSILKIISELK